MELFSQYSQLRRDDQVIKGKIKETIKELGYLALAITLAATYVGRTRRLQSDIKQYVPEYRQRRRELLNRKPENLIHQYKEASVLMTMLSFLSFDDVFLRLFGVSN